MKLNIKIKKVTPTAQMPTKAHTTDAGTTFMPASATMKMALYAMAQA